MESQSPSELRGALKELAITLQYQIDFRVMPQDDGQPDFMEAAQCLDKITGDDGWAAAAKGPHFDTRRVNDKVVYSMPVVVSAYMLMLLKWHDLAKEEVRVLSERAL